MYTYYEVAVTQTTKAINSKKDYIITYEETKRFGTIDEVKSYLKEQYQGHKRVKMYQDNKSGEALHVGYIYCFKDSEYYQGKRKQFWRNDWVSIKQIQTSTIVINP